LFLLPFSDTKDTHLQTSSNTAATPEQANAGGGAAESASCDPLLDCLLILGRLEQRHCTADSLTAGLPLVKGRLTPALFLRAARRIGLSARVIRRPLEQISNLVLPAVLLLSDDMACILDRIDGDGKATLIQPETGLGMRTARLEDLAGSYTGYAIFVQKVHRFDERTRDVRLTRPQHWFRDTLAEAWPIYSEVGLAALLINLFALASPLFIMNVYDRVVPNHAIETLWVLAAGVAVVYLFDLLMRTLRGYFLDVAGKRADIVLSSLVFEQVLGTRMAERPPSVGAYANNLHEFDGFRDFFTSVTLTALIDLPFVFLFVFTIWLVAGPLALVPLAVLPLSLLTGLLIQRVLAGKIQELMQHSSQRHATLIETLIGMETIKSLGAEGVTQGRWEQLAGTIAQLGLKTRFLSAMAVNLTQFMQQLATVSVVIWGVYLIADGELSMGGLVAATILTGRALAPLAQVAGIITRYTQARTAYNATDRIMHATVERPANRAFLDRPVLSGDIEFRNVSFSYPHQETPALDNVSFRISAGEHVAIIGRIGSGKTTIERLMLGLYEPSEGSILLDRTDSRQLDPADLRRNMGYVSQDGSLFYGTLRDNILLGSPHADDQAMLEAARIAGVSDFAGLHPSGFDLQVGERGERLSGGQRQSVSIARALLRDPPILIMDEPSNAMDNTTEEQLRSRLADWSPGKTLILVTHRASLLSLVDRVIVMDCARIIADGPKQQVLDALRQGRIRVPQP
jgi:ATP-binding cassette subfamily C protein LapB